MSAGEVPCPACGVAPMEVFHSQDELPVNSCLLLDDRNQAVGFPRGIMRLGVCRTCGFIANTAFDPQASEYSSRYEETQSFSPKFQEFAADLAKRWIDRYDIVGKDIVEIGCGKGEFLVLMCELGENRGVGIDPGVHPERIDGKVGERIRFEADFYNDQYGPLDADVVVCRHTLEHIAPVEEFMRTVRRGIGDRLDTVVLFELPDVLRVLKETAFWDVYYEHCSYFTPGSLARLFRRTGFDVLDISLDYDDQYILIEAMPSAEPTGQTAPLPIEADLDATFEAAEHFASTFDQTMARWRSDVADVVASGGKVVLWGSGSKGVAYLTSLGLVEEIRYVVDINPFKHGKFLAGTGQLIVPPEFLKEYRPDLVVAMNPVYTDEIGAELESMGVGAKLVAV